MDFLAFFARKSYFKSLDFKEFDKTIIKILELGEEKTPHEFTCFGAVVASHFYVECCVAFLLPGYTLVD